MEWNPGGYHGGWPYEHNDFTASEMKRVLPNVALEC